MSQNFKAVAQLQAKLHLLEIENLDLPFSQIRSHIYVYTYINTIASYIVKPKPIATWILFSLRT